MCVCIYYISYIIYHISYIIYHISYIIYYILYIIYYISYIIYILYIIQYISYIYIYIYHTYTVYIYIYIYALYFNTFLSASLFTWRTALALSFPLPFRHKSRVLLITAFTWKFVGPDLFQFIPCKNGSFSRYSIAFITNSSETCLLCCLLFLVCWLQLYSNL